MLMINTTLYNSNSIKNKVIWNKYNLIYIKTKPKVKV